jgi:DNA-binding MarR family transcriptional regulator
MASIEEEIKQKKFKSEKHKAVIQIMFTSGWLYNTQATVLKNYDITPEQYNVLRILRGAYPNPIMLSEITCRMIDKSSNATRLVEKLRLKGMVTRHICENNRRQVDILITQAGLGVLTEIDNAKNGIDSVTKTITETEAKELNRILEKLRK